MEKREHKVLGADRSEGTGVLSNSGTYMPKVSSGRDERKSPLDHEAKSPKASLARNGGSLPLTNAADIYGDATDAVG